eukprot:1864230-Pyramimonas_sp.AAC.1
MSTKGCAASPSVRRIVSASASSSGRSTSSTVGSAPPPPAAVGSAAAPHIPCRCRCHASRLVSSWRVSRRYSQRGAVRDSYSHSTLKSFTLINK